MTYQRPYAMILTDSITRNSAGESQWNKENRFTGWVDVPLAEVLLFCLGYKCLGVCVA